MHELCFLEDFGYHLQGIPKNGEIPSQMMQIEKNLKTLGIQSLLQLLTSFFRYFPNAQISIFWTLLENICKVSQKIQILFPNAN